MASETKGAPLTEEETRVSVELMFAIITELYSLSSAWTIRLSLLTAAKTFLLRPNNPQLESIRLLLQDSVINANFSDAGLAAHINKLRENCLPTEEELKKQPPEPTPAEKERLRVKARKLLVEKGMPRDDAYKAVQENAMAAWETESSFRERVAADARVTKYLDVKALEHTFDLKRQLRYVDAIVARVFGEKSAAKRAQS